jgi:hypothetical protein
MRGTSEAKGIRKSECGSRNGESRSRFRIALAIFVGFTLTAWLAGCTEFSHFGQISDRESAFSINDVKIEQQKPGGAWKTIGYTDGKGKWNIFKVNIGGGGKVRFSKPGYETLVMYESEFLQQNNILMRATGETQYGDEYLREQYREPE